MRASATRHFTRFYLNLKLICTSTFTWKTTSCSRERFRWNRPRKRLHPAHFGWMVGQTETGCEEVGRIGTLKSASRVLLRLSIDGGIGLGIGNRTAESGFILGGKVGVWELFGVHRLLDSVPTRCSS